MKHDLIPKMSFFYKSMIARAMVTKISGDFGIKSLVRNTFHTTDRKFILLP